MTVPLFVFLVNFISRSRIGRAMRATAQDPQAARLMGINVDTTISFTFLLGGLMAGAAGLIYALYQTDVWFFAGFTAGLISFTAAVMGGIGNLKGAVLGGLIIGVHPADLRQPDRHRVDAGDRVRLPRADPRVPPAGPARRADEGGRMSTADRTQARAASSCRSKVGRFPLGTSSRPWRSSSRSLLPFFYDSGSGFIDDATVALVYVVMALGLNIVVGFAGLLDLGYVAFFAIGAYTMGWFGSSWFTGRRASTSASPSSCRASRASTSTGC